MNIFYVENHQAFIAAVKREFLLDHNIHVVGNVCSAKEEFNDSYDLVLCDYDLDDGKGTEVITHIRKINSKIPIIAVSSHEKGNKLLVKAGANSICSKMEFRLLPNCIRKLTN
ncbi:response regulator [Vibrio sp. Of7-15]|uniref:response regulator n=1 Tax=Vibrio sp. Of7-15 TaxID=2724879 RepID=UPI001EF32B0A|nr:response regulator [Vibrio sp. Of7-15]MCG7499705.1 response regulator [Vibrio sp. Of7-15]